MVKIECLGEVEEWVYDIQTRNTNKFFANDILVHNSVYLNLGPLVEKVYDDARNVEKVIKFMDKICEEKIQPFIDKSYQELADYVHAYAQKMYMKREALADKAIWTAKKRYILHVYNNEGVQYAKPKMKIMGLEAIKSSTPSACRDKIKSALDIILTKDEKSLQDYVDKFKSEFSSLPLEDIAFPRSVNGLNKYSKSDTIYNKGTPMHVKAALVYNHYLNEKNLVRQYEVIKEGEKIKYIALKEPNPYRNNTMAFQNRIPKEFEIEKWIDYNTQFKKAFLDPLTIVLDSIGWEAEKRNSLEDFF